MAKAKPPEGQENQDPTQWTNQEIGELLSQYDKAVADVAALSQTVSELRVLVNNHAVDLAAMGPIRDSVPLDIGRGIQAKEVFQSALHGSIIGLIASYGPTQLRDNIKTRKSIAAAALDVAQAVLQEATDRYGMR